jgi:hypothetical protein
MARLETSGTMNCGVMSLCGLEYVGIHEREVETIGNFSYTLNYQTHFKSAATKNMDFDELMKIVEEHTTLSKKVIISAQPEPLILKNEKYWHKKLKKAGFRLICKAKNPTGYPIWFYMRIPSPIPIIKGDR